MIKVKKIIPGGMGLGALADGKKVFLWNALPGEVVTKYEVVKNKPHYQEVIATNLSITSNHRVAPKDACFLSTSPWQIMDYKYELEQKSILIAETFLEHKIAINAPTVYTDYHPYFYRNKMEYALYWDHQTSSIKLALHQRGTHRKIPIRTSSIERPEIFRHATEIINTINLHHDEARRYQSLLLRCDQNGRVSGGLLPNNTPHPHFSDLKDEILGHTYHYSPNGFFQINLPVYEMALTEIKKHIGDHPVLDLYSGVGTIGLSVATGHELTLIESNPTAFAELQKNCYNVDSASFPSPPRVSLRKSEDALEYIQSEQTVILDPPRAGCEKKLIDKLLTTTPRRIIYLSCNPATQARDISLLSSKYRIDLVEAFNFFPRTPHIENLVVLSYIT